MLSNIDTKKAIIDGVSLVLGVFLYALCFNMFLIPNDLVVSGFSGVAIVVQRLFGWSASAFIYITNGILLIVSLIFLGWKMTKRNIVGSVMYPVMITASEPIAKFLNSYIMGDDFYLILLFAIIMYGVSSGLIYRTGFSTGGSDIIMQILNKYLKISESKAMIVANSLIIIASMLVFGFTKGVYSFIILICSTYFIDKLMFGLSDSKVFYIYTKKVRKIKKIILNDFQTGFTSIPSRGGYSRKRGFMIMCVVSNRDYYLFKQKILEIDPQAFIIINSCYEVNGGVKRKTLPFL